MTLSRTLAICHMHVNSSTETHSWNSIRAVPESKFSSRAEEYNLDSGTARILFQEWVSVLELTCMWQMAKVRERVIEEISNLFRQVGHQDLIYLLKVLD